MSIKTGKEEFMTKIKTSVFELANSSNFCNKKRDFSSIEIKKINEQPMDKKLGVMEAIDRICFQSEPEDIDILPELFCNITGADIGQYIQVTEEGDASGLSTEEKTLVYQVSELVRITTRYVNDEIRNKRTPLDLTGIDPIPVCIGDYEIYVKPEKVFFTPSKGVNMAQIEAVKYTLSAAPSGVTKKKTLIGQVQAFDEKMEAEDKTYEKFDFARIGIAAKWLNQYINLAWIRLMLQDKSFCQKLGLTKGDKVIATGNVYYLKMKSKDKDQLSFFDGNLAVAGLEETVIAMDDTVHPTELDDIFEAYGEAYKLGKEFHECSKEDCDKCPTRVFCDFQPAKEPVKKDTNIIASNANNKFIPTCAQQKIVELEDGVNLVIARAGSGKTAVLAKLILRLIDKGVQPSKILMHTFTRNSTIEFKERVLSQMAERGMDLGDVPKITTFHEMAMEVIRDNYEELGFTELPKELNEADNGRIVKEILDEADIETNSFLSSVNYETGAPNIISAAITLFNIFAETIDYDAKEILKSLSTSQKKGLNENIIDNIYDIYEEYLEAIKEENIILFSQMEPMFHEVLAAHPGYLEKYGFEAVLVDEFQDSSDIQAQTIKAYKEAGVKLIVAVGDDNQSIYAFRNANLNNFFNLGEILGCEVNEIKMLENFRSSGEILDLSDNFLDLNKNKTEGHAVPGRGFSGTKPIVRAFHKKEAEQEYIVKKIKENGQKGVAFNHQAIIVRTHKEAAKMIPFLTKAGIPWVIKMPMKYKDSSRVQAAVDFIENIFWNPSDNYGYVAYVAAKYNGKVLEMLSAEEIEDEIDNLKAEFYNIERLNMHMQRQKLHKYLDAIRLSDEIYESFLDDYLYTYGDLYAELEALIAFKQFGNKMAKKLEQDYDGVVIVTAHSAKGLEWDVCYVSTSEFDSEFLHKKKNIEELEETRRLLYVSMTRARDMLYVTGQYTVKGTTGRSLAEGGPVYNQFMKSLYELTNQFFDPIDHEEIEKKRAKARARYQKALNDQIKKEERLARRKGKARSREMTSREKREYDVMTTNSRQLSIFDI